MARLLSLIFIAIGALALVGGVMMAGIGLLLFVGSNLFPNVADIRVQESVAFIGGGVLLVAIGWILLMLLTRIHLASTTVGDDCISRELHSRHK